MDVSSSGSPAPRRGWLTVPPAPGAPGWTIEAARTGETTATESGDVAFFPSLMPKNTVALFSPSRGARSLATRIPAGKSVRRVGSNTAFFGVAGPMAVRETTAKSVSRASVSTVPRSTASAAVLSAQASRR